MNEEKIYALAACVALTIMLILFTGALALLQSLMESGHKKKAISAFLEKMENDIECRKAEQTAFVGALEGSVIGNATGRIAFDNLYSDIERSLTEYNQLKDKFYDTGFYYEPTDERRVSIEYAALECYYNALECAVFKMAREFNPEEPAPDETEAVENGVILHNDVQLD